MFFPREKGLNLIRLPLLPIRPFLPLALLTLLQQEGEKDAYRTITPFHLGDVREEREVGTKAHRIASDQRPPVGVEGGGWEKSQKIENPAFRMGRGGWAEFEIRNTCFGS